MCSSFLLSVFKMTVTTDGAVGADVKEYEEREQKDMRCFGSSSDHPCVCVSVFACVWVCVFCPNCPTDGIIASGTISLHRRSSGKKDNTNIKDGKKY